MMVPLGEEGEAARVKSVIDSPGPYSMRCLEQRGKIFQKEIYQI